MTYTGRCRCGAVRFEVDAEPVMARSCWCRDCQYWAAGNATVNVFFPSAAVTVEGETTDFASTADSGNVMHRRFCPKCGTPLFSAAESRPHVVGIRSGALDDKSIAKPRVVIWTDSAPSWAHFDPDIPTFPGAPPP